MCSTAPNSLLDVKVVLCWTLYVVHVVIGCCAFMPQHSFYLSYDGMLVSWSRVRGGWRRKVVNFYCECKYKNKWTCNASPMKICTCLGHICPDRSHCIICTSSDMFWMILLQLKHLIIEGRDQKWDMFHFLVNVIASRLQRAATNATIAPIVPKRLPTATAIL